MLNFLLALGLFSVLAILLLLASMAGIRFKRWHLAYMHEKKVEVLTAAEAAVFGLLGLLIAFTFSGAYDRFEHRKFHIIEESSAYAAAYQRVDLLEAKLQGSLRPDIAQYLDLRLKAYKDLPHLHQVAKDIRETKIIQDKIWAEAVNAVKQDENPEIAGQLIPALNTMFDEADTGITMSMVHPPVMVFVLLLVLSLLGAFLSGYTSSDARVEKSLYLICYVVLVAFTLYIIVDLEFPRMGMIRVDAFDRVLEELVNDWQQAALPSKTLSVQSQSGAGLHKP